MIELDFPHGHRWEVFDRSTLCGVMKQYAHPWWIAGGWAVDLHVGHQTRDHKDVDVAVLRRDLPELHRVLRDWDLRYAAPTHELLPWDGSPFDPPTHAVWARRCPGDPWLCEFLTEETDGDQWRFRRMPEVARPLATMAPPVESVAPVLALEVIMLYKATEERAEDRFLGERDLAVSAHRVVPEARKWLAEAIASWDPQHAWLSHPWWLWPSEARGCATA